MKFLRFIFLFVAFCSATYLSAQELRCTVTINSEQVQGSNKEMFNTLKQSIEEFVNNQNVKCTLLLTHESHY